MQELEESEKEEKVQRDRPFKQFAYGERRKEVAARRFWLGKVCCPMRDSNKSIGREGAVCSRDRELKMLGEGAQQKRRQLSETSALGKIRL